MSIKDWLDERIGKKWRKRLDQLMHFLWTFIALTPIAVWGATVPACVLSALFLALPRELVDQWPIEHWDDTLIDLIFFALGGAVVGMIF